MFRRAEQRLRRQIAELDDDARSELEASVTRVVRAYPRTSIVAACTAGFLAATSRSARGRRAPQWSWLARAVLKFTS